MEDRCININSAVWYIKYITREEMIMIVKDNEDQYTQGITIYSQQTIYIDKTVANPKRVLIHELTHAWLNAFGHNQHNKEWNNEDVCEIVASIYHFMVNTLNDMEKVE